MPEFATMLAKKASSGRAMILNCGMNPVLRWSFVAMVFLATFQAPASTPDGTPPQVVITRLVTNAAKKPPGPVENDLTEQTVKGFAAMSDFMQQDQGPKSSPHTEIVKEFSEATIEGPMACVYSDSAATIFSVKVKMTDAALADEKADEKGNTTGTDSTVSFGDAGGGVMFVGPNVRDDGIIIATFCLVRQKGAWKVHCAYLSDDPLKDEDLNFIVTQLTAFALKSQKP